MHWLPSPLRFNRGAGDKIDIGIGFQLGTSAPTLTDFGVSFAIATGGVLTQVLAAPPNGGSVWVRVVDQVSGAVFEQEINADLPANT